MSMRGPLRMVGGIFYAFDCGALEGLIRIRKFLYALVVRVGYFRETLRAARLSSAARSYLRGIVSEFVELGLIVALKIGIAFEGGVLGIFILSHGWNLEGGPALGCCLGVCSG